MKAKIITIKFLSMPSRKIIYRIIATLFALFTAIKPTSTPAITSEIISTKMPLLNNENKVNSSIRTNPDVAFSSSKMSSGPYIFQSGFNTATWSGYLKKIGITQDTSGDIRISQQIQWEAGALLTTSQTPTSRVIATYNTSNKQTVAFKLDQLPEPIRTLFHLSPDTGIKDDSGIQRVNYLTGDRTMETINANPARPRFRMRENVLGDIIHSAPVYVGAPAKNITGADYQAFYDQHKSRPGTVFVGANDGMLHAFSADSGAELFAYIPSPLLKKLPKLTDPAYQHELTMDGNSYVAEAQVNNQWKTVLTAGMGQGAKGVFALDVTSPEQFMTGKRALFEFTEADDPDMGYITSPPLIAKVRIGKDNNGRSNYQYFVAVTSGYNPDNTGAGTNGEQFLFLLSLDKNPLIPWSENSNYYKLSTNSNNASTTNALSIPGLALNAQGAAIYGYSGDLQGNVWRFDFTDDNPASIAPKIIFTAKDKYNNPQSIITQPVVSPAPDGGYLVLFGTGHHVETAQNNFIKNSFYAIRDTTKHKKEDYFITGRSQLATRELVKATMNGKSGYQVVGKNFSYGPSESDKKGWYIDFKSDFPSDYQSKNKCEEHSLSASAIFYRNVFFNTVIPDSAVCDKAGTGISYMVNVLTGKSGTTNSLTGFQSQVGKLGVPVIVTTQSSVGNQHSTGRRDVAQSFSVINFGTGGVNGSFEVIDQGNVTIKAGRLSWREISNWKDLKNQPDPHR